MLITMGMATPHVLDLNQLLEDYAWRFFQDLETVRKGRSEFKGLDRSDVHFEINLKRLIVQHEEPQYVNLTATSPKPYTLLKSSFTNNTARPQEYSFKAERMTESVCTLCREQGYSLGEEAELTLKTPCEILEFKAGFRHEMHVNKIQENSITEQLTWGADSHIVVPPHFQTTAELVVEEMQYRGSFSVNTRLSGPVTITLVRRRDGFLIMPVSANILEVFRDAAENARGNNAKDLKAISVVEGNCVKLVSKGTCSFQFAMKQRVSLNEEPIRANNGLVD